MSKRIKIFTPEDVAAHRTSASCWISRGGKVYDVTSFLPDHPGGDDAVLAVAGTGVGAAMKDPKGHEHSEAAYDMMEEYCIGRLGEGETLVSDGEYTLTVEREDGADRRGGRLGGDGRLPSRGDGHVARL